MSANYLGQLISIERLRRRWSIGDLARRCGAVTARQTSRTAQRLVLFERESVRDRNLLQRVISALDLDVVTVVGLLDRQHLEELEEWNRWADEEVPMELHMRPFAGLWIKLPLPVEIAADELRAIEYAKQMTAARRELIVVLALNRRRSLTIREGQIVAAMEATPNVTATPFMSIGGERTCSRPIS